MPTVADLVDDAALRSLADPETYARGKELAGRVRMSAFGPQRAGASVESGGEPAVVELSVTPDGLAWTCSAGDASPALVCPHVIAVALQTRRRSPGRRS